MDRSFVDRLTRAIDEGERILRTPSPEDPSEYRSWHRRLAAYLWQRDERLADVFGNAEESAYQISWAPVLERELGVLEGALHSVIESLAVSDRFQVDSVGRGDSHRGGKRVFVVHGHDTAWKESVARFVTKLGLDPVILHEQPSGSRSILEKLEAHSDVGFATVLLTADDIGSVSGVNQNLKPRARQNVVFELGYFVGRLGRSRVCALYQEGVELPSDLHGIVYVPLDPNNGWKTKLAQEYVQAGLQIKIDGLLG